MKYQVFAHVGNNEWQVIGIHDHFYKTYKEAQLSLQDSLDNYGDDFTQYKIVTFYEFKDILFIIFMIVLFLIFCAASLGV